MLTEIREQPAVIRAFGEAQWEVARAAAVACADAPFAMIAARGTSDHAAAYAKYLLEVRCGIPVALAAPSVSTLYGGALKLRGAMVIGVSQSGEATDVCAVLRDAHSAGAITLAITNKADSPLADVADFVLPAMAGPEKSVAATKTYTGTLAAFYLLAGALSGSQSVAAELGTVADAMETALTSAPEIEWLAERFRFVEEMVVLGRGLNYATAMETALKLIETSYVLAKSYSSADFMHGPIALLRQGFPCMVFANNGPTLPAMLEQASHLLERKAELLVVSDNEDLLGLARSPLRVPFGLSDELAPLVYIVYGQLFAYYLARTRGFDPDKPRALNKVTRTL